MICVRNFALFLNINYLSSPFLTLLILFIYFYFYFYLGTDLTIWGTGSPLRQFIYSRDLARLTVRIYLEQTYSLFSYTLYFAYLHAHYFLTLQIFCYECMYVLSLYQSIFNLIMTISYHVRTDLGDENVPQSRANYSLSGRGRRDLDRRCS